MLNGFWQRMRTGVGQWSGVICINENVKVWMCVELICVGQIYGNSLSRVSLVD